MNKTKMFLIACLTMIVVVLQGNFFNTYGMTVNGGSWYVVWSEIDCQGSMIVAAQNAADAWDLAYAYGGHSIELADFQECYNLI